MLNRNLMSVIQTRTNTYMNRMPIFTNTFWWTQKNRARRHQFKWAQSYQKTQQNIIWFWDATKCWTEIWCPASKNRQKCIWVELLFLKTLSGERRRTGRDVISLDEHRATKNTTKQNLILRCYHMLNRNLMSGIQKRRNMYINRILFFFFVNTFWWTQKNRARGHQFKWAQSCYKHNTT